VTEERKSDLKIIDFFFGGGGVRTLMNRLFLGAFAKFRKTSVSLLMSVCLSVRMEQLGV
jgi:hypothetical protein